MLRYKLITKYLLPQKTKTILNTLTLIHFIIVFNVCGLVKQLQSCIPIIYNIYIYILYSKKRLICVQQEDLIEVNVLGSVLSVKNCLRTKIKLILCTFQKINPFETT